LLLNRTADQLEKLIQKRLSLVAAPAPEYVLLGDSHRAAATAQVPMRFVEVDTDEIGMELVVLDSEIFQGITPRDYIHLERAATNPFLLLSIQCERVCIE
jgi:hypothetical protein